MMVLNFQLKRAMTKATIHAKNSVIATAGIVMMAEFTNLCPKAPASQALV